MKQHKKLTAFQIIRKVEKMERHYNKLRKMRKKVRENNDKKIHYNY